MYCSNFIGNDKGKSRYWGEYPQPIVLVPTIASRDFTKLKASRFRSDTGNSKVRNCLKMCEY